MIGIYKITNLQNGHCYIGQSVDIARRWSEHKTNSKGGCKYPLYLAFQKYGLDNFSFEVLEECKIEELDLKEIAFIKEFDSYNNGYNLTTGGQFGNSNNCVKISKEDINIIYDLLMNSEITQREIAKIFNVGEDTISEINQGRTRINPNLDYPLRKKKEQYCIDCGKKIYFKSTRCFECDSKHKQKVERPSREELKQMIRIKTFVQIAKEFNVSDKAITKWCKKENLPYRKKDIKSYSDEEWSKL